MAVAWSPITCGAAPSAKRRRCMRPDDVPPAAARGCGRGEHVFRRIGGMGAVPRHGHARCVEHTPRHDRHFRRRDRDDVRCGWQHPLRGFALDLVDRQLYGRRGDTRRLGLAITVALPSTMNVLRYREYRPLPQARRRRWQWRPSGWWALGVATALSLSIFGMWQHPEFLYFQF